MNSKQLYMRLLGYLRPYRKVFAAAIAGMIAFSATQPLFAMLLKQLLDESFVAKNLQSIQLMPVLFILLFAARGTASFISSTAMAWVSSRIVMDIRAGMFNQILVLPKSYMDNNPAGNLISKITFNVTQVTTACTMALVTLIQDSLILTGLLAWMFYLNWQLALVFFIIVPIAAVTIKLASSRLRKLSHSLQDSMGDMTHILEEGINGQKVIKIFGGEDYEKSRFFIINNWIRRLTIKIKVASALNVSVIEFIAATALAIIIYIASIKSASDEITVGGFISFFAAMAMLFSPAKRLASLNEVLQRGLAASESVFNLLDEEPENDTGKDEIDRAEGHLIFRNACFRYADTDTDAIHQIDLDIQPGETIALVGQSGSGKSTLVNLVSRFYGIQQGEILLDGKNIKELSLENLRKHIALVSQDIILFDDTLAANIAYGSMNRSTQEEIQAAARAAHAIEYIDTLPDGMQTRVGENGVKLSGGQRQRLAIARALLKDAPILIFDEATSALDTESERYVQDAINTIRKGRTTIVIAHRLSTIMSADRIIVMEKGRIIETGKHAELLQKNGTYAKLYHLQFEQKR
ncbi:MAG TPA: lipid A export permease/ATP-binding protein MsbA [Gammaproteobacteria bacterium]|nr:lipid A export permease/ATP-binding protein MsbA [Gammaproteobacteria bacterium]